MPYCIIVTLIVITHNLIMIVLASDTAAPQRQKWDMTQQTDIDNHVRSNRMCENWSTMLQINNWHGKWCCARLMLFHVVSLWICRQVAATLTIPLLFISQFSCEIFHDLLNSWSSVLSSGMSERAYFHSISLLLPISWREYFHVKEVAIM